MDYRRLTDLELLQCVVGTSEAKRVYEGKLTPLFKPQSDLCRAHLKLAAAHELIKRWLIEEMQCDQILSSPPLVRDFLHTFFAGQEHESFVVLYLNNQHRLIRAEELFRGTIDGASVYPREVVKLALRVNAAAVILAHNHPSGMAEPSQADRFLTRRLKEGLSLVDVRVLDHMVIAGPNAVSFAERGWV